MNNSPQRQHGGARLLAITLPGGLILTLALGFMGCATPPEIKSASRAQLELINELGKSEAALAQGLQQFSDDKLVLIEQEGRMKVARHAIASAASDPKALATADEIFAIARKQVRPLIDNAFMLEQVEQAIKQSQALQNKIQDPVARQLVAETLKDLQDQSDDLRTRQVPTGVKEAEAQAAKAMAGERKDAEEVGRLLQVLHSQIAMMQATSRVVDDWLAADVTITQQQFDSLDQAYGEAIKALQARKP